MIITNATITRIDAPATVLPDASRSFVEGAATSVRCAWQRPRTGQKWILGAEITDASAVLYVSGNQTGVISKGGRVLVLVDGEAAARLYSVLAVEPQIGLGLDHTEVYLEGV